MNMEVGNENCHCCDENLKLSMAILKDIKQKDLEKSRKEVCLSCKRIHELLLLAIAGSNIAIPREKKRSGNLFTFLEKTGAYFIFRLCLKLSKHLCEKDLQTPDDHSSFIYAIRGTRVREDYRAEAEIATQPGVPARKRQIVGKYRTASHYSPLLSEAELNERALCTFLEHSNHGSFLDSCCLSSGQCSGESKDQHGQETKCFLGWQTYEQAAESSDSESGWQTYEQAVESSDSESGWQTYEQAVESSDNESGWQTYKQAVESADNESGWQTYKQATESLESESGWQTYKQATESSECESSWQTYKQSAESLESESGWQAYKQQAAGPEHFTSWTNDELLKKSGSLFRLCQQDIDRIFDRLIIGKRELARIRVNETCA